MQMTRAATGPRTSGRARPFTKIEVTTGTGVTSVAAAPPACDRRDSAAGGYMPWDEGRSGKALQDWINARPLAGARQIEVARPGPVPRLRRSVDRTLFGAVRLLAIGDDAAPRSRSPS